MIERDPNTREGQSGAAATDLAPVTTLRDEIERLCLDSYERGAVDAVTTLIEAFRQVGMTDAARLAEGAIPRLKVPHV